MRPIGPFAFAVFLAAAPVALAGPLEEAARDLETRVETLAAEVAALKARLDGQEPRFQQTPLVALNLPGRIEAEDFDLGGEGVAYHDTTAGNVKEEYRAEDVDIEATGDADGLYNVGWTAPGEWMEYTVDVLEGRYDLRLRVASKPGATEAVRVSLDGAILGVADVPATGGWQAWETVTIPGIALAGGRAQVLRLELLRRGVNLNWIRFERVGELTAAGPPSDLLLLTQACSAEVGQQLR